MCLLQQPNSKACKCLSDRSFLNRKVSLLFLCLSHPVLKSYLCHHCKSFVSIVFPNEVLVLVLVILLRRVGYRAETPTSKNTPLEFYNERTPKNINKNSSINTYSHTIEHVLTSAGAERIVAFLPCGPLWNHSCQFSLISHDVKRSNN